MGLKYGGKLVADYSAMIGPCSDGFHVPSKDEWGAVKDIWVSLGGGSTDGTNFGKYLKLPLGGARNKTTSAVGNRGTMGDYRSVDAYDFDKGYHLYLHASYLSPDAKNVKTYGMYIRPFKDSPITPTSSWTKLYGTSIEAGGIFWSSTDGLISLSSDGQTWITIADKNLGATTVWNDGDTLTDDNCGGYFQWGNNYMFSFSGNVTTSSTRVNATNYGPGNYYSSSTYITYDGSWDSSYNNNLRGGETGVKQNPAQIVKRYYGGKMITDYSAMRGPCPVGFHVPSKDEWVALCGILTTTFSLSADSVTMGTYLKLPLAGWRTGSYSSSQGVDGFYWASTASVTDEAYNLIFDGLDIDPQNSSYRRSCFPVRAFKDSPTIPTSSWTTLYQGTGSAGVFWDNTDGLISVSGDGANWYTIQDKNLGATTVYNQGDAEIEANCGGYFQWGNNYMFPFTGAVTTSSTQVDASTYGPGNYYESSTFITGNDDWSSVQNDNLRGGDTGVQQRPAEVIKVYKGNIQIRPVASAEFTDWESSVWDYVSQAFSDAGYDIGTAIANLFGGDFAQSIETATGTDLSDWEFSPIMPFYPITTSWDGLQISNGGDMIDKHLVSEAPGYTQSICIIRDNDNLSDAEYIVGTYDSSDDGFDYQLSSLASNFSGKDTVCMFIFLM